MKTKQERINWWNNLSSVEQEVYARNRNSKWWDSLSVKQQDWIRWNSKKDRENWINKRS